MYVQAGVRPAAVELIDLRERDYGGARPKLLLETLMAARGAAVTVEHLAQLLWGENRPRNVASTVGAYVSVLRHRLQQGPVIVAEPGGYRFDDAAVRVLASA
jgi:DNA-binding SARP family transcriptional activator